MNFEDWKKHEREKSSIFFGRAQELAELQAFLSDKNARIFGLYGVPMIGKTTLLHEFLKSVKDYEIQIVKFQNPENPETTLDKILSRRPSHIHKETGKSKLIIIENFEEALQWKGNQAHLHEIKFAKIKQFLIDMQEEPLVKIILESRFQIKIDFLPKHICTELKDKQLGKIDRKELFNKLNQLYRNNTVSFETFDKLCEKFNDHIWLIETVMQDEWEFENVLEAVQNPTSITQKLWEKLQDIIRRLTGPQKILLCAFSLINPIPEIALETQLKTLPAFKRSDALNDALWSLRKKLLTIYNAQNKSYELNPFLREVCFTFLQDQKEMKALDALPYFHNLQKPRYDRIKQANEKGDYRTFFRLLKEKRKEGKYDEVMDILREAYWTNPKKEVILNEIGITYKMQGDFENAEHYFNQAGDLGNIHSYNELGILYKEQGEYNKAISIFKNLIEKNKHIPACNELAIIYKEGGKYPEAIAILNMALEINGEDVKTLNELALIYREQKNFPQAIQTAKTALSVEPLNVKVLNVLATIYKEQGDYRNALATVQRGLKVEPYNDILKNTLKHIQEEEYRLKSGSESQKDKTSISKSQDVQYQNNTVKKLIAKTNTTETTQKTALIEEITTEKERSMVKKKNLLVIFANPKGTDALRLSAEDRTIRECIKLSINRDNINIRIIHAARIKDIQRELLDGEYQIIQFSGHGCPSGRLVLEDEVGEAKPVPQQALAKLLSSFPSIECVVLNACYSVNQGELISLGVPVTIGMNGPISDDAAQVFIRGFYDALGAGKSYDFAYNMGCQTIELELENCSEELVPKLFTN